MPPKFMPPPKPPLPGLTPSPTGPSFAQTLQDARDRVHRELQSYTGSRHPQTKLFERRFRAVIQYGMSVDFVGDRQDEFINCRKILSGFIKKQQQICSDQDDLNLMEKLYEDDPADDSLAEIRDEIIGYILEIPGLRAKVEQALADDPRQMKLHYEQVKKDMEEYARWTIRLSEWTNILGDLVHAQKTDYDTYNKIVAEKDDQILQLQTELADVETNLRTSEEARDQERNSYRNVVESEKKNHQIELNQARRQIDSNLVAENQRLRDDQSRSDSKLIQTNDRLNSEIRKMTKENKKLTKENKKLTKDVENAALVAAQQLGPSKLWSVEEILNTHPDRLLLHEWVSHSYTFRPPPALVPTPATDHLIYTEYPFGREGEELKLSKTVYSPIYDTEEEQIKAEKQVMALSIPSLRAQLLFAMRYKDYHSPEKSVNALVEVQKAFRAEEFARLEKRCNVSEEAVKELEDENNRLQRALHDHLQEVTELRKLEQPARDYLPAHNERLGLRQEVVDLKIKLKALQDSESKLRNTVNTQTQLVDGISVFARDKAQIDNEVLNEYWGDIRGTLDELERTGESDLQSTIKSLRIYLDTSRKVPFFNQNQSKIDVSLDILVHGTNVLREHIEALVKALLDQIRACQKNIAEVNSKLNDTKIELDKLEQNSTNELDLERRRRGEEVGKCNEELKTVRSNHEDIVQRLRKDHDAAITEKDKRHQDIVAQANTDIQQLQIQESSLIQQVNGLKRDSEDLKTKLDSKETEVKACTAQLTQANQQLELYKTKATSVEQQLETMNGDLQTARATITGLKDDSRDQQQIDQTEKAVLRIEKDHLTNRIKEIVEEKEEIVKQRNVAVETAENCKQERAALDARNQANQDTILRLQTQIDDLQPIAAEVHTLHLSVLNRDNQISHLRNDMTFKNAKIVEFEQVEKTLRSDIRQDKAALQQCKLEAEGLKLNLGLWKKVVTSYIGRIEHDRVVQDGLIKQIFDYHTQLRTYLFVRPKTFNLWSRVLQIESKSGDPVAIAVKLWCTSMDHPVVYRDVITMCSNISSTMDPGHIDFVIALCRQTCHQLAADVAGWNDDNWMAFLRLVEIVAYSFRQGNITELGPLAILIDHMTLSTSDVFVRAHFDFVKDLLRPSIYHSIGLAKPMTELAGEKIIHKGPYRLFCHGDDLIVICTDGSTQYDISVFGPESVTATTHEMYWALKLNNLNTEGFAYQIVFDTDDESEVKNIETVLESVLDRCFADDKRYKEMPLR